jgi:hypothetical protein
VHLQRLRGGRRRRSAPHRIDQAIGWDRSVRLEEERHEKDALLLAAEIERRAFVEHLEGTEDPEVHGSTLTRAKPHA